EASVLESPPIEQGMIYVKTQAGTANVGLALANSNSDSNTITINLFNQEGFLAITRTVTLPANGHLARFVTEIFPELATAADFDGALSMRSSTEFSALALRLSYDKIATLPVAPFGMFRPAITGARVTSTQRTQGIVNFEVDVTDLDSDVATSSSTTVLAIGIV